MSTQLVQAMSLETGTALPSAPVLAGTRSSQPLAWITGFYFCFRLFFVLLAVRVFGLDAQVGVAASLALNFGLLACASLAGTSNARRTLRDIARLPAMWAVCAFLLLTGASLFWTVTASLPAAVAFWCAMVADLLTVALLLRQRPIDGVIEPFMRGYIAGACAVALVAWLLPRQSDLRLGDEELLGPNQIAWACAFALWFVQYLARRSSGSSLLLSLLLGVTLLRSLSKTTILAFAVGEAYVLLRDRGMSRRTKLLLLLTTLGVLALFSGLLMQYWDVYQSAGNQVETLTGRLGIWAYILNEAIEKPWFGHGFHSVWKVIPPFGAFEARHAHNELLQQFYAYGVAGVLVTVCVYGSLLRQLRRTQLHKGQTSSLRVLFTGMVLFALVRGLADTEVFDLSLPMWTIVIIAALLGDASRTTGTFA